MDLEQVGAHWREHGYALLPGFLSQADIDPAQEALSAVFPTTEEFHDDVDHPRNAPFRDEFGGILEFPWAEVQLCLLAVHPRLVELAETVLATTDLRLYSAEAWAKYTGAAEYDQELHRDYHNHTPLVPSSDLRFAQLEMFVWLSDVTEAHGPTHVVSRQLTRHLPAWPNWLQSIGRSRTVRSGGLRRRAGWHRARLLAGNLPPWDGHDGLPWRPVLLARQLAASGRGVGEPTRLGWSSVAVPARMEPVRRPGLTSSALTFRVSTSWSSVLDRETLAGMAQRYRGFDVSAWRGARADAPVRRPN